MRNYQHRMWWRRDRVERHVVPPEDSSWSIIEGSTADMLDTARAWRAQSGPQGLAHLAPELLEACDQTFAIELLPHEMELIDDRQGWWAAGDRVTLYSTGRAVTLHVRLTADSRPDDPRRIDCEHMETSATPEYEFDGWAPQLVDLPGPILDRLHGELQAQRLRLAPGEHAKLIPGRQYDPDYLRCVGWTDGDGTGVEGYSYAAYLDGDRYLGPDEHGIEPVFTGLRWPA